MNDVALDDIATSRVDSDPEKAEKVTTTFGITDKRHIAFLLILIYGAANENEKQFAEQLKQDFLTEKPEPETISKYRKFF